MKIIHDERYDQVKLVFDKHYNSTTATSYNSNGHKGTGYFRYQEVNKTIKEWITQLSKEGYDLDIYITINICTFELELSKKEEHECPPYTYDYDYNYDYLIDFPHSDL